MRIKIQGYTRLALAAAAVLLAGAGLGATAATNNPSPFGVGSSAEASGLYASWLPKMAAAGVKWVRLFPDWNQIEPKEGTWSWTTMDGMLNAAEANHLNLTGLFLYNATWANTNGATFPTNNLAAWSTYVSNVVAHARGRVKYWEVWNEPENFAAKGTPEDYARVVTNAYYAAKSADPNAQISMSVASVDILYLERAIKAGAAGHFDYICVHPYEVLGTVDSGQEAEFMSIVPTIRKMLAAEDRPKWKVPIWFTEIGEALGGQVTATSQARDLVKSYTMAIAQGVSCIEWFEAREGGYKMGLLNSSGNPTPAYSALKNLVTTMGSNPVYQGWVQLNNQDYGFVFQGAATSVMAAWAPPGVTDSVDFGQTVQVIEPVSGGKVATQTYALSNAPVLVLDVPSNLVSEAHTNLGRPFPWGGDYSGASAVSVTMGEPNVERGLHQLNADATSTAVTVYGGAARDCSKGSGVTFTVDPNFLSYTTASIRITAVVRRNAANDNAGFNLKYESKAGRKGIGWNTVPGNDRWYTLTWTISDDEFVGDWAYHFSFDSDSTTYSKYYLQQVTVTNLTPRPTSAPTGLVATGSVSQVSLLWEGVPRATSYDVRRAASSGGAFSLVAPSLAATSYTDTGLTGIEPYYYVVSAVNSGGEGPISAEAVAAPTAPSLSPRLLADGSLRLSWPDSATGFALEMASVLPGPWTNSEANVQARGSESMAVVPPANEAGFFRLRQ